MRPPLLTPCALLLGSMLWHTAGVCALTTLDDEDLGGVEAQSGLTIAVSNANAIGGSASSYNWTTNAGNSTLQATWILQGLQMNGIGNNGGALVSPTAGPFSITDTFDIGALPSYVVDLDWTSNWTRLRLMNSNMILANAAGTNSAYGFGAMAADTSGTFTFINAGVLNSAGLGSSGGLPTFAPATQNQMLHLTIGTPQIILGSGAPGTYGQLYYRQGAAGQPELVFDKWYADIGFRPGTGGVIGACAGVSSQCGTFGANASGLYIGTPYLAFNFTTSLNLRAPGASDTTPFTTTTGSEVNGLSYWGWTGGFDNAELLVAGNGLGKWNSAAYNPDNPASSNQGIHLSFHGNYDPDFNWLVGGASGQVLLDFGSWTTLPGASWGLNAPNMTFNVINGGQEPGGLCYGAQSYGTAAACTGSTFTRFNGQVVNGQYLDANSNTTGTTPKLALALRDLSLQAYSTKVTVLDNGASTSGVFPSASQTTYNWGLIYTLGTVDGNFYLYPGSSGGTANGVTADILFMTQSFGKNTNPLLGNTNLMIADTNSNLAIGLLQANALVAAQKLSLGFLGAGASSPYGGAALANGGIELKTGNARINMQGMVGGGSIPTMPLQLNLMTVNNNLEFANYTTGGITYPGFDLVVSPATGGTGNAYDYLAYGGNFNVGSATGFGSGSGTFFSWGEPSASEAGANITIGNITGSLTLQNGRLFLISGSDALDTSSSTGSADGNQRLQIAQTMLVGATATTAGGNPLSGTVSLSQFTFNASGGVQSITPQTLGTLMIPSGIIGSSLELKRQGIP